MRFSTFLFLAVFAGFALHHRARAGLVRGIAAVCEGPSLRCEASEPSRSHVSSARIRELEREIDRLERRGRDLDRSLQAVAQSTRTLRDLAKRHDDDDVRAELSKIEDGRSRLQDLRDRTEVERVTLTARLQLARAGLEFPEDRADDSRPSPVDALSSVELARSSRVTSRAR